MSSAWFSTLEIALFEVRSLHAISSWVHLGSSLSCGHASGEKAHRMSGIPEGSGYIESSGHRNIQDNVVRLSDEQLEPSTEDLFFCAVVDFVVWGAEFDLCRIVGRAKGDHFDDHKLTNCCGLA